MPESDGYKPSNGPGVTLCALCMEKIVEGEVTDMWQQLDGSQVIVHESCLDELDE